MQQLASMKREHQDLKICQEKKKKKSWILVKSSACCCDTDQSDGMWRGGGRLQKPALCPWLMQADAEFCTTDVMVQRIIRTADGQHMLSTWAGSVHAAV